MNRIISGCGIGATIGQFSNQSPLTGEWRGINGQWHLGSRGVNQWSGPVAATANAWARASRAFGVLGMGLSAVQGYRAYQREGVSGTIKPAIDFGVGSIGTFTGPAGAAAAGIYFGVDMTVGWRRVLTPSPEECRRQQLYFRYGPR